MKARKLLILLFFIICQITVFSQYFFPGQEPFSTKWYQIESQHFKLIYPKEKASTALYVINLLEQNDSLIAYNYNHLPRKSTIILHNQGIYFMGFVMWAPQRSEYFLTPLNSGISDYTLRLLAIHEQRHYMQVAKLNQGLCSKLLYSVVGEQSAGFLIGMYLPRWFLEGDAVLTETLLTNSGSGRWPSFSAPLKAELDYHGRFTYNKAVFGSYKHFTADPYVLGYNMVYWGQKKYGSELWNSAVTYSGKRAYTGSGFNYGLKKVSGLNKVKIYQQSLADVAGHDTLKVKNRKQDNYISYNSPVSFGDSTIVIKSGMSILRHACLITGNKEKKLFHFTSLLGRERFSTSKQYITWAEQKPHPRWIHKHKSEIKLYNRITQKTKKLSHDSSLFAPSLSPDAKTIACLSISEEHKQSVNIYTIETESTDKIIDAGIECEIYQPFWLNDSTIGYLSASTKGKDIILVNKNTSATDTIFNSGNHLISFPIVAKNYIVFTGGFTKTRNLFALDYRSGKLFQITDELYEAMYPSYDASNNQIVYSSYTAEGNRIKRIGFNPESWKPISVPQESIYPEIEKLVLKDSLKPATIDTLVQYEEKKYRKIPHLFNFHSWMPTPREINPLDEDAPEIGFQILSQNKLSSCLSSVGFSSQYENRDKELFFDFAYHGLWPIISLQNTYGTVNYEEKDLSMNKFSSIAAIKLPYSFNYGKFRGKVQGMAATEYQFNHNIYSETRNVKQHTQLIVPQYQFYVLNYSKSTIRDFESPWLQNIRLDYKHSVEGTDYDYGELKAVQCLFHFPSVFKHHVLKIKGGYQIKDTANYVLRDVIFLARSFSSMKRGKETKSLSVSYACPLSYPDLSVGSVYYLKRIRGEVFYDVTFKDETKYSSIGCEVYGENFFARLPIPFENGVRISYQEQTENISAQFLFRLALEKMPQ